MLLYHGMKYFKAILGISPNQIRPTVIISPIIYPKHFGQKTSADKSQLGFITVDLGNITLIKTPMTQGAVKDAVLLLAQTRCRQIVFAGAIGGLSKDLKIGDILVTNNPKHIFSFDSLSDETPEKLKQLQKQKVLGIDFESRALFAAAKKVKLPVTAYYVVTVRPPRKPFYLKKTAKEKQRVTDALDQIVKLVIY